MGLHAAAAARGGGLIGLGSLHPGGPARAALRRTCTQAGMCPAADAGMEPHRALFATALRVPAARCPDAAQGAVRAVVSVCALLAHPQKPHVQASGTRSGSSLLLPSLPLALCRSRDAVARQSTRCVLAGQRCCACHLTPAVQASAHSRAAHAPVGGQCGDALSLCAPRRR